MNAELLDKIYNCEWLDPRDRRVLELKYRKGLYNYQIAMEMHCSPKTIERILKKIRFRVEPIIVQYYKNNLV